MALLQAHDVVLDLPKGWDGRIRRREQVDPELAPASRTLTTVGRPGHTPVVAQAASVSLPADTGDFGGGAVERMGMSDIFLSLVEFDADSVGTALFKREGLPRQLRRDAFSPSALQRVIQGQGGTQVFFTAAGRPFCLYVVLGSYTLRGRSLPVVNGLLSGIQIH